MNPAGSQHHLLDLVRRNLFSSICTVISLLLIAATWILWQDVHTLEALNRERSQGGQAMLSTRVSGPLVRQELARAQEVVQRMNANLVEESKLAENYAYFFKLQRDTGSQMVFLRQQNIPVSDSDYVAIPFTLQLAGSYQQVASFLLAIETGPKLAQVRSFSFRRRESTADSFTLNLELKLLGKP